MRILREGRVLSEGKMTTMNETVSTSVTSSKDYKIVMDGMEEYWLNNVVPEKSWANSLLFIGKCNVEGNMDADFMFDEDEDAIPRINSDFLAKFLLYNLNDAQNKKILAAIKEKMGIAGNLNAQSTNVLSKALYKDKVIMNLLKKVNARLTRYFNDY